MMRLPRNFRDNVLFVLALFCYSQTHLTLAASTDVLPIAPTNAAGQRHHPLHPLDCLTVGGLGPRQLPPNYDAQLAAYIPNGGSYSLPYSGDTQSYGQSQNEFRRGGLYGSGYGQAAPNYGGSLNGGYIRNALTGGSYGGGLSGDYGRNSFPPSYVYTDRYGQYGISGYEGPFNGFNTYSQPGISYPPYYGGSQCQDRSVDCAFLSSSGQCQTSSSTRALCPLSCGTGCATAAGLVGSTGSHPPFGQFTPPFSLSLDTSNIFPESMYVRYQQQQSPYVGGFRDYGSYGGTGYGPYDYHGEQLLCIDSHIQGCANWARLRYCTVYPDFMLSYCKVSCGVCQPQSSYGDGYLDRGLSYNRQLGSGFGYDRTFDLLGGNFNALNPSIFNPSGFNTMGLGLDGLGLNDLNSEIRLGNPFVARPLFNPKNTSAVLSIDRVLDREQSSGGGAAKNPFQTNSATGTGKTSIDSATATDTSSGSSSSSSLSERLLTRLRSNAAASAGNTESDTWRLRGKAFDSINAPRDTPLKASVVRMDDLHNS